MPKMRLLSGLVLMVAALSVRAGDLTDDLKKGTPEIASAGPLGFGPVGVLFVADPKGAATYEVGDPDFAVFAVDFESELKAMLLAIVKAGESIT